MTEADLKLIKETPQSDLTDEHTRACAALKEHVPALKEYTKAAIMAQQSRTRLFLRMLHDRGAEIIAVPLAGTLSVNTPPEEFDQLLKTICAAGKPSLAILDTVRGTVAIYGEGLK